MSDAEKVSRKPRLLAPEVVQSSGMDCGPASLKAFLEGHGIPISYGRLREACQTDVDGTSIETLEEIAGQLGLPAEQILIPKDHVLLPEARALPAIAVARLPNGNMHFIVVWRNHRGLVQVMDPAAGRRWLSRKALLHELHEHVMKVPAADWRDWAASEEGLEPLRLRLRALGTGAGLIEALITEALSDASFRGLAALDATARSVRAMIDAGGVRRGGEAARVVETLFRKSRGPDPSQAIPRGYWSVRPVADEDEQVLIRGAVLVRAAREPSPVDENEGLEPVSAAVLAAHETEPPRPGRALFARLREDGLFAPAAVGAALVAAATAIVIEALLFRSLLELAPLLGLSEYRLGALLALLSFMLVMLLVDYPIASSELRLGRRLEMKLRTAFQEKIPRLGDRFFHSRLTSDMAERNHSLHLMKTLPHLVGRTLRDSFELLLTAAAIVWLEPASAPLVILSTVVVLVVPLLAMPILHERDLRLRSHLGALSRFYLDALLGLVPLRVHGAEPAMRTEHESLLVEWGRSRLGLQRAVVGLEAIQFVVGYGLIVLLLFDYFQRGGEPAAVLLLAYWALNLPVLGLSVVQQLWRYPELRNITLRLLEPLGAPEERELAPAPPGQIEESGEREKSRKGEGMAVRFHGVQVRAAGHRILEEVEVAIAPGEHVAIVGPSGAGKSSLVGLLLGWNFPDQGRVEVDGRLLSGDRLEALRGETAWVDPSIQLWNQSLIENLRYGNGNSASLPLTQVIEQAELRKVLEMLPEGHQTLLGEGGGLVSGGEGQRVRLARAFLRQNVRLAILDEPFRGLDRPRRAELLKRARTLWRDTTLLCVTHDVSETEAFDRVLVLEDGRIVEDASPSVLSARDSRYRRLLDSERALMELWSDGHWRQWELSGGKILDPRGRA